MSDIRVKLLWYDIPLFDFQLFLNTAKVIFDYEFWHSSTNTAETARNSNAVFEEDTANEHTLCYCFNRFRIGNFDLNNEPEKDQPLRLINDDGGSRSVSTYPGICDKIWL